jgi:hypothetical protein
MVRDARHPVGIYGSEKILGNTRSSTSSAPNQPARRARAAPLRALMSIRAV